MAKLIYFSSTSNNTHRFVEKLGLDCVRLPVHTRDETHLATEPFVLVVPTYGGGNDGGAVPKQVVKFLNVEANRNLIRGVIAAGNTNFGDAFCLAGDIIAAKCRTQLLYRVELMGTPEDVERVRTGLEIFWKRTPSRQSA
ncbi:class Ib ribonucleoside-diphosphate reductase assembly flavoprotein NrdI [Pseudarthrobacter sp. BIM B-2242]|uniref:class Ib ribonucleoside-diphosphate reductase assembly flavoprotein NrdI n=1 Tax=Pseudarthrobacter sp. BIM B-2242 TaxID=2772401 RepID=UPI001CC5E558|nr:class Ib ribonucleoside-diphosphate reductase assembly flavoprotein NrdI [Pseudarthrobacter sp. BIM B-2242]